MKYREDINGLRAIAVLSVVLYHAGVPWLTGGFAGVDIFFVISGYLITRILVEEASTGSFLIANFYARRARRLLPVLYLILVVVLLLGVILLLPLEAVSLSESVLATSLFSSNFLFWKQAGYFDVSAELKPLLHTWSLSVEEQFYVLWPIVLVFCLRRGWPIRRVIPVLLSLSFAISSMFLTDSPISVFYLLPGRAWELLIGAWLATDDFYWSKTQWRKNALSVAGLGLLAASFLLLNKSLPFPGWNALLPCLGAALLIAAGERAFVNRYLLAWPPFVFVGLISYSLYLWHWPLLSYVRILNLGQLPPVQAGITVALSFLLATLTWRYIENPFRQRGATASSISQLIKYALLGLLLCVMAWLVVYFKGFPNRISVQALAAQEASKDFNAARGLCHLNMDQVSLPDSEKCTHPRISGTQSQTLAVWGDSHGEAVFPGVVVMPGLPEGLMLQMTKTSCPPLIGAEVVRGGRVYKECADFNSEAINFLRSRADITAVAMAARWPVYALEAGFGVPESSPGAPTYALRAGGGKRPSQSTSLAELAMALDRTIEVLERAGKKVYLIGAIPEMQFDVPGCIARQRMTPMAVQQCGLNQEVVALRIDAVNMTIAAAAAKRGNAIALFPDRVLCNGGYCGVEGAEDQILYYDHNHLSTVGARYVFSRLMPKE